MDVDAFFNYTHRQMETRSTPNLRTVICASGGVGTAMLFAKAKGANHVQVQKYANSGDVPGFALL
jgi:predicted class III extradiol MEMO1 family dioxygenase